MFIYAMEMSIRATKWWTMYGNDTSRVKKFAMCYHKRYRLHHVSIVLVITLTEKKTMKQACIKKLQQFVFYHYHMKLIIYCNIQILLHSLQRYVNLKINEPKDNESK